MTEIIKYIVESEDGKQTICETYQEALDIYSDLKSQGKRVTIKEDKKMLLKG